ncbi:MAG: hypothetical protein U5N85_13745 [Arcicella sp.]|nr:hypothetical protein [Arcicella sp.]
MLPYIPDLISLNTITPELFKHRLNGFWGFKREYITKHSTRFLRFNENNYIFH